VVTDQSGRRRHHFGWLQASLRHLDFPHITFIGIILFMPL
jgi:hypothetical protein